TYGIGRVSARTIDEAQSAIGTEHEDNADVAAGLPAILVVDRVDLAVVVAGTTGALDSRRQEGHGLGRIDNSVVASGHAARSAAVLDLLEHDKIRRSQIGDDQTGERVELRWSVTRIQVLHIERRDFQLVWNATLRN